MRAAGYIRVSTQKQADQGYSLDDQRAEIQARCEAEGWELELYEDRGLSAAAGKHRPELERLLVDAERKAFDVVVFRDLDRVGRSVVDLSRIVTSLECVPRIVTLEGRNVDRSTAEGRLQFNVLASVSEYEREKIGERVAGSARARALRGLFPGGRRVKFGYRRRGKDEAPAIVEAEAALVRRLYELADGGSTRRELASRLRAEGVRTTEGNHWCPQNIGRLLRDPTYKGCITIKGEVVFEGGAWAIVDPELWERVNLTTRARTSSPGRGAGRRTNGRHLLIGGLLRCSCGAAMGSRTDPRHGHEYYLCRNRNELKPGTPGRCEQPYVPRELVDGALIEYFSRIGLDVEATRTDYLVRTEHELAAARALRAEAEREQMRIQERLDRVKRDYLDGKLDAETWAELKTELADQAAAAGASRDRQLDREAELTIASEIRDLEADLLERLAQLRAAVVGEVRDADTVEAVRAAFTRLFESFTLLPRPVGVSIPQLLQRVARGDERGRSVLAGMLGAELEDVEAIGGGPVSAVAGVQAGASYVLLPHVRREALQGLTRALEPVLRREPIGLGARLQTNELTACSWLDSLLGPIEVGIR